MLQIWLWKQSNAEIPNCRASCAAPNPGLQSGEFKPRGPNLGIQTRNPSQASKRRIPNPGIQTHESKRWTPNPGLQTQESNPGVPAKCRPRQTRNQSTWTTCFTLHLLHDLYFQTQDSKLRAPNPGLQTRDSKPRNPNPRLKTLESKLKFQSTSPHPGLQTQESKAGIQSGNPSSGIQTRNPGKMSTTASQELRKHVDHTFRSTF